MLTLDADVTGSTHTYAEPGPYAVGVTVTDDDGGTHTWVEHLLVGCTQVGTDANDLMIGLWADDVICGLAETI